MAAVGNVPLSVSTTTGPPTNGIHNYNGKFLTNSSTAACLSVCQRVNAAVT
jgi:hypothetical protein